MRGYVLLSLLFLGSIACAQGRANVFFSTSDRLETRFADLEDALQAHRSQLVLDRLGRLLTTLLAPGPEEPVARSARFATSPWDRLGKLWEQLDAGARREARRRILESCTPAEDDRRCLRIFFAVADPELRRRLGPPLAARLFEKGGLQSALRVYKLLAAGATSQAERNWYLAAARAAARLSEGAAAGIVVEPAGDPDLARVLSRIEAEQESAGIRSIRYGPWASPVTGVRLGSIRARFNLPQEEVSFRNLNAAACAPVAAGDVFFATNGSVVLAVNAVGGRLLWRTDLGRLRTSLRDAILTPAVDRSAVYVARPDRICSLSGSSGSILWTRFLHLTENEDLFLSDEPPEVEPSIAVTPPLLVGDSLYIGVVIHRAGGAAASLLCLEAPSGKLLWERKVGSAETRDFLRLGSTPLPLVNEAGRIFFCPNLGFIAACDQGDGAILFLRTYPRMDVLACKYSIRREDRWRPTPPVVWRNFVILAPQDSNELLFFDLWTGALQGRIERRGADYFLGPYDGALYMIGRTLRRIDLKDGPPGSLVYEVELPGRTVGRGHVEPGALALPFRDRLVVFVPKSGKVQATYPWETAGGGGTLLPCPWGTIVAHRRGLDLYRPLAEDIASLDSATAPQSLLRLKQAHVALKTGDFKTAFSLLEGYITTAPRYVVSEEKRERLQVARLLGAWLELKPPPDIQLALIKFRTHEYFAPNDREAVDALLTKAAYFESIGELKQALDTYFEALARAQRAQRQGAEAVVVLRWGLAADAVPHLTAKIGALLSKAPDPSALLAPWEAKAQAELKRAQSAPNAQAFRDIMYTFPFTRAGGEAYLRCARFYLANQNSQAAKDVLRGYLRAFPSGPAAPQAALELAEILRAGGENGEARRLYRLLKERFPQAQVTWEGQRLTVAQWVERSAAEASRIRSQEGPVLQLPLKTLWRTRTDLLDRAASLRFLDLEGDSENKYLLVRGDSFLRLYRSGTGKLLGVVKAPLYCNKAGLLREDNREVIAASGRTEVVLWPSGLFAEPKTVSVGKDDQPSTYIVDTWFGADRFVCLSGKKLVAYDAQGKSLWERVLAFRGRAPLAVHNGRLIVFAASEPAFAVVNLNTGKPERTFRLTGQAGRFSLSPVVLPDGKAVLVAGRNIRLVDLETGSTVWAYLTERMLPRACRFLPGHPETIYLWGWSKTGCRFIALDRRTGRNTFAGFFSAAEAVTDIQAAGTDLVALCGDLSRSLVRFSPQGRRVVKQWRRRLYRSFDTGLPLVVSGGTAFVGDREVNRITAVSLRTGMVLDEGTTAVRRFLAGRLLRDYRISGEKLFVLTEAGAAAFTYADPYREEPPLAALLLTTVGAGPQVEGLADTAYTLSQLLLNRNRADTALRVLDRILWERRPRPENAFHLWFLLGAAQESVARKEPLIIRCLPAPADITIDGYLEEAWPIRTAVRLESPQAVLPIQGPDHLIPSWQGPDDLSATFFCAWDKNYFYFALDVRDDMVLPHDPEGERWLGDTLIIDVDPRGDGGMYPGMDDQMLTLYLTVRPARRGAEDKEKPEGRFKARVTDDRSGIVYEVALPWRSLDFDMKDRKVEPGAAFGFNVVITDDDVGTGARQALSLNASHLLGWKRDRAWEAFRPDYFPKIMLEDPSRP